MENRYDIFISYSRQDLDFVRSIKTALEESTGANCWMDLNAIESGSSQFSQDITDGIDNCKVFLFMLSKQSQDSEFALLELNYARDEKKHIVLINIDDCRMTGAFKLYYGLTDQIAWNNQPQQEKLFRDLKRWIQPVVEKDKSLGEQVDMSVNEDTFLKLKSDLDCTFYLDGEEKAKLQANKLLKFALKKGEYELKFVSLENEKDILAEDFVMPTMDKRYDVKLVPIREQRLERERAEADEQERLAGEEAERIRREKERLAEEARKKAEWEPKEREKREAERKAKEESERKLTFTVNGVSFCMIKVEGGSFWMGADNGQRTRTVTKKGLFRYKEEQETWIDRSVRNFDEDASFSESPVHSVTLSTFYIGETVVTQALWRAVMGSNRSYFEGDNRPVDNESWDNCQEFIRKLNSLTGKNFRLPTEAEWEFAARGGNNSNGYKYAGSNSIDNVAWYCKNSRSTQAVKGKLPNELGLYDMSGNILEWCSDWFGGYSSGSQTTPQGASSGSYRVLRGGVWYYSAEDCRVSYRNGDFPTNVANYHGFRLALPR